MCQRVPRSPELGRADRRHVRIGSKKPTHGLVDNLHAPSHMTVTGSSEDGRPDPYIDAALPRLTRLARALGLAAVESTSVGLATWAALSHKVMPGYVSHNELASAGRRYAFLDMTEGLVVAAVIAAVVFIWKRDRGLDLIERASRRLSPWCLAAFVPFLVDRRLWDGSDLVFLPLVVVFGWGLYAGLRTALDTKPIFPRFAEVAGRLRRRWTEAARLRAALWRVDAQLVAVIAGASAYAVYFSIVTIVNHRNLGTSSFDLGLEENLMWNLVHGGHFFKSSPFSGPTGTHFGNHATFFAYVIAPIYALAPHPETLLIIQAVILGGGAIPLYLYARRHVPPSTAAIVAFAYLVYPPLHGANLYDFHYLPMGVPFLWWTLYAAEARKHALAIVAALLALSMREDVAACLAVIGVFMLLMGTAARAGALIAGVAGGYFLILKLAIMPAFAGGNESFLNQYSGLMPPGEHGFAGILKTLVANPVFTANIVFERDKVAYVFQLMAPLLFLPLTRPIGMLLVLPGLAFTLLSTGYWPLYQPSFQYTSYWTSFVFIGVVVALEHRGRPRYEGELGGPARRCTLALAIAAASFACTNRDGALLNRDNVRGGFGRIHLNTTESDLRNRADLAAVVRQIPADGRIVASERLVPHVASRSDAYTLRNGTFDADWLLFQMPLGGDERSHALSLLKDGSFGVVHESGEMVLAQRGSPTTQNADLIARMEP